MKRPSFQFYPADWMANAKLRRCTEAARGAWVDVMCVLHDFDEYGVCRWPLEDLARAAGVSPGSIQELVDKDVLKGADANARAFIHTPRTGNVEGAPVTLVKTEDGGPCWYSPRMVHDEWVRTRRGGRTRFTPENQPTRIPNRPVGTRQGNGASSPSSSSSNLSSSTSTTVEETFVRAQLEAPDARATAAGKACKAIMAHGIQANPSHPELIAAIAEGITTQEFADAALECKNKGKSFPYLIAMVRRRKGEAAASTLRKPEPKPASHAPALVRRQCAERTAPPQEFKDLASKLGLDAFSATPESAPH